MANTQQNFNIPTLTSSYNAQNRNAHQLAAEIEDVESAIELRRIEYTVTRNSEISSKPSSALVNKRPASL